ncbi:MAG: hypothetical protein NC039_02300 [Muribaculaceae bacterium]|nr:hypothetical protein [Muribaculaceae bacterium]
MISKRRYLIFTLLISGCIFIPDSFVVDNINLLRDYFFVAVSIILFIIYLFSGKVRQIYVNSLSVAVLCGLLLIMVRNPSDYLVNICAIAFTCLLLMANGLTFKKGTIARCVTAICSVETIVCYLQLLNITDSTNSFFHVTGSFENPNTYGIFTSLCFPFILHSYKESTHKPFYITVVSAVVLMLLIVECRTALICCLLTYLFMSGKIRGLIAQKRFLILIPIIVLAICLYDPKPSLGRLLILVSTLSMIGSMPIFGYGTYGFYKHYMESQSTMLSLDQAGWFAGLEGNPMHPLNEYLNYVLNVGYIGFLFIAVFIYYLIKDRHEYDKVFYSGLLNLALMLLITNCLRYSFVWVFAILFISQFSSRSKKFDLAPIRYPSLVLLSACLIYVISDMRFELRWKEAYNDFLTARSRERGIEEYEILYHEWHHNPFFLYNYAAVLNLSGDYEKSNALIKHYNNYVNDYQSVILRGDNSYELEDYETAIRDYQRSHEMCPTRFQPLWGLLQCYKRTDREKYLETAREIYEKEIKIDSYQIQVMKKQCKKILEDEINKS